MTKPAHTNSAPPQDESFRNFALWALDALQLHCQSGDQRIFTLHAPEDNPSLFQGAGFVRFMVDAAPDGVADGAAPPGTELLAPGSRMFTWITDQLRARTAPLHARPASQITGVQELSAALFEAYRIEGGRIHLAGCTLEDRPIVRLTYESTDPAESGSLWQVYVAPDGTRLDESLVEGLGLGELAAPAARPPKVDDAFIRRWVERSSRQQAAPHWRFVVPTIIWCKYAEGKLAISIEPETVELTFEGWAQLLASGKLSPPAYTCPITGHTSRHLAATDNGRITVEEAIAVCEHTGQRVLETELSRCAATGKRVLSEHLVVCPVTGQKVLASTLKRCSMCRQAVSPLALHGGRCRACRNVRCLHKDHPLMARVLGEYPKLDAWKRWQMSETTDVYVLVASSVLKRLLVVLDKAMFTVRYLATGNRWTGRWVEADPHQRDELLG